MKLHEFLFRELNRMEAEQGRRITNEEISDVIGVDVSSISKWMNGKVIPSKANFVRLALFFGPAVLNFSKDEIDVDLDLIYINQTLRNLDKTKRKSIREFTDSYRASLESGEISEDTNLDEFIVRKWAADHGYTITKLETSPKRKPAQEAKR